MESWMVNETPVKNTVNDFNPGLPYAEDPSWKTITRMRYTKSDYENILWLFGGRSR